MFYSPGGYWGDDVPPAAEGCAPGCPVPVGGDHLDECETGGEPMSVPLGPVADIRRPRVVRNYFLSGRVDGVDTPIATGPKGRGGEFELTVLMRGPDGEPHNALALLGTVGDDGALNLTVLDGDGNRLARVTA